MQEALYTIGHSNQSFESFLASLRIHGVTAIADVRSYPYSNANPHFDRELLASQLQANEIAYVFLGAELGARTADQGCYVNGKVRYDLLAKTPLFCEGLHRVQLGMDRFRVALMCAEAEPLDCHRTILIARRLREIQVPVRHILKDGAIEDHEQSVERLLRRLKMTNHDMFRGRAALIDEAYRLQEERIAYQPTAGESQDKNKRPQHDEAIYDRLY